MINQWNEHTCKHNIQNEWNDTTKEAYLYEKLDGNRVKCNLCPRKCIIEKGKVGVCKVRKNIDGVLYAQTYEKAAHLAVEKIETEAIFHYEPGADILSLGTIGCNLNCSYCQNWALSQAEYASANVISKCTSEAIIKRAKENNIKILSWTYNEPAVWFEFVIDTARMAKKQGIISLFKSAYFLSEEAIDLLTEVIDVFAISLKSISDEYYRVHTGGWIDPVLNCIKKIYHSGKHFEIENLVVTGLTDKEEEYLKLINFVLQELDCNIPLHFSSFHPDYKYTHLPKVNISDISKARDLAMSQGIKHVYVGNVFENKGLHTYCSKCQTKLIERFGLCSQILDTMDNAGKCKICGTDNHVKFME